jgi:hypothetical protein
MYVWDVAESTATIIAACIPALRVLIRSELTRIYKTPTLGGVSGETPRTQGSGDVFAVNKKGLNRSGFAEYELESSSTRQSQRTGFR